MTSALSLCSTSELLSAPGSPCTPTRANEAPEAAEELEWSRTLRKAATPWPRPALSSPSMEAAPADLQVVRVAKVTSQPSAQQAQTQGPLASMGGELGAPVVS